VNESLKEVFRYSEVNAKAAKQCRNDDMPLTTAPMKRMMENPRREIKTLDDLAEWFAMPKGELQNPIAWCFKRFAYFQTKSITISISVVSMMQNILGTMQQQLQ